jgi:hypothetical protein
MAQSYLIFDFGGNEEAAQQARHKLDGWRQAFHLDRKIQYKLERSTPDNTDGGEKIRLFVRLDFSDHERLSRQRWLDRIPREAPFQGQTCEKVQRNDEGYAQTAETYDNLD